MREYINVYQLDDIASLIKPSDYFLVSRDALSYKASGQDMMDFIEVELDIHNADRLLGYGLSFTPPLEDYQLLTFDATENAWVNRELDIDAVFRGADFEAGEFLRLDMNKKVISSEVKVSDLVIDSSDKSNLFLAVDASGSNVTYVDVVQLVDDAVDKRHDAIMPILRAEITRSIAEDERLEQMILDETHRASVEEQRIEDKFDTMIPLEVEKLETRIDDLEVEFENKLQSEIDRAIAEEQRIEALFVGFPALVEAEKNRAQTEERRLENLIIAGIADLEVKIEECCEYLKGLIAAEEERAKTEERRLEDMIIAEIARAIAEEQRLEALIQAEEQRAIGEEQRIEDLIPDIIDSIPNLTGNRDDGASARIVKDIYDALQDVIEDVANAPKIIDSIPSLTGNRDDGASARIVKIIYDMAKSNETRIDNLDIPDLGDVEMPDVMKVVTQWFNDNSGYQANTNGKHGAYFMKMPNGMMIQYGGGTTGSNGVRKIQMLSTFLNPQYVGFVTERHALGWMANWTSSPNGVITKDNLYPTIYGHNAGDQVNNTTSTMSVVGTQYRPNNPHHWIGPAGLTFNWLALGHYK